MDAVDKPLIVVSGLGRCGSSLVMQMLHAAGIRCAGQWPAFEDVRAGAESVDAAWLAGQRGGAVKILDPQRSRPKLPERRYTIFLTRDHDEQAKSCAKFGRLLCGIEMSRRMVRRLAASYGPDERAARAALALDSAPHRRLPFEFFVCRPADAAAVLALDLAPWWRLDAEAMARVVVDRDPLCFPGLLEAELMERAPVTPADDSAVALEPA